MPSPLCAPRPLSSPSASSWAYARWGGRELRGRRLPRAAVSEAGGGGAWFGRLRREPSTHYIAFCKAACGTVHQAFATVHPSSIGRCHPGRLECCSLPLPPGPHHTSVGGALLRTPMLQLGGGRGAGACLQLGLVALAGGARKGSSGWHSLKPLPFCNCQVELYPHISPSSSFPLSFPLLPH